MTGRRAVLTVDLDCPKCRGLGQRPRTLQVGYGPSAHEITVSEPCKCVRVGISASAPRLTVSDQHARNIALALGWVACLALGDRAGWAHHRHRDVGGRWEHWFAGKYALANAGMWDERPYPFEPFDDA